MIPLLADAIQAHGGLVRWGAHRCLAAKFVTSGDLWAWKAVEQDQTARTIRIDLHREWASIESFGTAGQPSEFSPERVAIKAGEHNVGAARKNPRASFAGHDMRTTWDPLHRVYFDGCMLWTYLATPFLLAMDGFEICEIEPLREGAEIWPGLRAVLPPAIASHSTQQDFYFGPDMLVRRHDYRMEIAGNIPVAQYLSDPVSIDGIKIPTKGRAYLRDEDLRPRVDAPIIMIDLSDLRFS
jgi:hypothetical protein